MRLLSRPVPVTPACWAQLKFSFKEYRMKSVVSLILVIMALFAMVAIAGCSDGGTDTQIYSEPSVTAY